MSEKFVASNGWELRSNGAIYSTDKTSLPLIGRGATEALRNLFLHERDTELGRWRWPDDPRYLVFPLKDDDEVRVLDENSGQSVAIRMSSFRPGLTHTHFVGAALAYFDTHPDPKPWHDAKPGEVWVFENSKTAEEVAYNVAVGPTFHRGRNVEFHPDGAPIKSARRIFPEVVSDDS